MTASEPKIRPYIIRISDPEKFQEDGGAPFGASPNQRWAAEYEVILGDKNVAEEYETLYQIHKFRARHTLNKFTNRTNGSLGVSFFFLVCSPAYAKDPVGSNHNREDVKRALLQNEFDQDAATQYLDGKIASIGELSPDKLGAALKEFLDTTEWEEE
ncbi:MAG TPA: hypothetical protein VLF71_03935 [Candidatus Saccharimonadales bacterium]|nr:hypothetical protein [Candidatus Saccharimonadales bacterium]